MQQGSTQVQEKKPERERSLLNCLKTSNYLMIMSVSLDHRIIEQLGLKGTFEDQLVQLHCRG